MRERIERWLKETHGTRFELLRHFLPRLFDSDVIASSSDWTRVASGALAALASSWILLAGILLFKYGKMAEMQLQSRFAAEAQADLATIAAMAACLTMLLVAMLWQALYPTLRDAMALAGYPISGADLFAAKFTSLGIVFGGSLSVVTVPCSVVFASLTSTNLAVAFLTIAAACSVTFFGLLALQGALLNVLPARLFERVMIWTQAILFALSLGGFSFAAWKGHALPGLMPETISELLGVAILPVIAAVLMYVVSFHRYSRLLLEVPRMPVPRRWDLLTWFLDRWIRDPREQAAFAFFWKTVQRSRIHRLAVLLCAGFAVAWIGKSLVDLTAESTSRREMEEVMFTAGPLTLLLFTSLGLRQLFSLPADLRSIWVFQITEREGRRSWLNAVERFVLCCGVLPVVVLGAVGVAFVGGPLPAVAWGVIAFLLAAIVFEFRFRNWKKMPFTCVYVPGRRPLLLNVILFFGLVPLVIPVAWILYVCATNPASLLVLLSLEALVYGLLRHSRLVNWGLQPLVYEEQPSGSIESYGLAEEGTIVAQEQFQRAWTNYLRGGDEEPILRPLEPFETRSARVWEWLRAAPQDLKYALRLLVRKPWFAFSVVMTLALGLGLNTAFFAIFNAFLLRPLAVRDPASLVSIQFETQMQQPLHLQWNEYQVLARSLQGSARAPFADIAVSSMEGIGLEGRAAHAAIVTSNYFTLLGVGVSMGRPLQAGDQDQVIVLSDKAWRSRFAGDPNIVGRRVLVGGIPFEVVGVAPPEFAGVGVGTVAIAPPEVTRIGFIAVDFWVPFEVWDRIPSFPHYPVYGIIGRLERNATVVQAQTMVTTQVRRITATRQRYDRVFRATLDTLDIPITWTALKYSLPLLIAFGLTMLIPCANAANMMLARAVARQRELGTRLSMGATRGRIVRQLLMESLVLALLAGVSGLVIALTVLSVFSRLLYKSAPPTLLFRFRVPELNVDSHVFVYMLVVAVLTTLLFALAPAAHATRIAVANSIRGEFGGFRSSRLRNALIIVQVSLCVMLLITASVMLRGSAKTIAIERGYQAHGVLGVANLGPEETKTLEGILKREPWVDSLAILGRPLRELDPLLAGSSQQGELQPIAFDHCSGEFFSMVRMPILRGRVFTREEAVSTAAVAVVSEMAAKQLWPGEDPVGKTIRMEAGQRVPTFRMPRFRQATVIGVSGDVVLKASDGGPRPVIYFPTHIQRGTVMVVRGKGTPEQTARLVDSALAKSPGGETGGRVVFLQETIDWESYPQQATSWLSTLLGVVALLLTVTGVYAVMSYLVSQKTKEIGIRMALGATRAQIASFVFTYSTRNAAAGMAAGMVLALGLLQYIVSRVDWNINVYDVGAYAVTGAVVVMAILLASAGPVRKACRLHPQDTLRMD